jgi:hypothetical protein
MVQAYIPKEFQMSFKTFDNPHNLDKITIFKRLSADPVVEIRLSATPITDGDGIPTGQFSYLAEIDSTLPEGQINSALSTAQTQAEVDAIANFMVARANGLNINQLGNHTAAQVEAYILAQVAAGTSEANAIAAVDALVTTNLTAFVNSLKPVLKAIIHAQYRQIDILQLIGDAIVSLRDFVWP